MGSNFQVGQFKYIFPSENEGVARDMLSSLLDDLIHSQNSS
jgi:hypothetical protein